MSILALAGHGQSPELSLPSTTPVLVVTPEDKRLDQLRHKELRQWSAADVSDWLRLFRDGHFFRIRAVFENVSGFDIATIADDDFRAHVHSLFRGTPANALVAIACWRQLRNFRNEDKHDEKGSMKRAKRRKRDPITFQRMVEILNMWQTKIDLGMSESVASKALEEDHRVCRTTLRSWRHIHKLATDNDIDLTVEAHRNKSVSLTYVHRLIGTYKPLL
jgi:hypothetical protein